MHTKGTRRAAIVVTALLLITAACSDDDDSADTTDTANANANANATTMTTEVEVGPALERYADYSSVSYDDASRWVCHPDATDICDSDLDVTVVNPDGTLSVQPFEKADAPAIDCFYVYPTISWDEGVTSDWEPSDDEEGFVTLNQAARLQSECRLFAPVYRQRTLTALVAGMGGGEAPEPSDDDADPYEDVLDAFRTYMANDNGGRGVVLIGHSQGAGLLNRLIREEIEPNPAVLDHLVAAYLAGAAVGVPEGAGIGGDFQHVPLCASATDTGCVVSWAAFRDDAPPPDGTFFGVPRDVGGGLSDGVAACTNPARLAGDTDELANVFPADRNASILTPGDETSGEPWIDASVGEIVTPFVTLPGLVTGDCATINGANVLSVTVHGDPDDPRADDITGDLTPEWGLHLVDLNLVMGDVVRLVGLQSEAYLN